MRDGRSYVGLDANAYYALSLSGNGARIVVRGWLESTVPESDISPVLPTQLLHSAIGGRAIPLAQGALAAAVRRQQLDPDNKLNPARLALIKACLLRSPNLPINKSHPLEPMTESLNPDARDAAYLCGRLFAVFDRLQYLALGGINAGVVQRFYASASVTPALVMGRLFRF